MSLFSLTKQERQVVLFLISVALIGLGISFLTKKCSKIRVIGYISQQEDKININQASKESLVGIPGIGEKLAQRIIDYRRHKGKFYNSAELKNIKGIGQTKYQAIKDYLNLE